ncbi:uncharacterized protein LOC127741497 [Arachis duranensis]|uniref:Uncharacterized protein LOC127741497 n=1 Tax=Arachis duranensis TaxID=130453 RepID=A0A9C6T9L0_ARADU|nr:uncharacterized protein LOC127741497 [Arachis duranensis]
MTWVVLAPKFVGAEEIKDLRLISMVGCVYKVISKVLVRRMRSVMPAIVGETQSAFVKGRKIHDGALIACETVNWLKLRKKEAAIIKLDFQKAYNRVKWSFLDFVLQKMGFGQKWRVWVMECVTTASLSILINGSPSKLFKMERGLRQGDPFFTLLVCSGCGCPASNDWRGKEETIKNYKRMLRYFELMSGLSINFDKSSLIPINCDEQWARRMCNLLGCKGATLPVKYLGISLGANPRLVKTWKPIIDKVEEKLSLWKAKLLNKAEKLRRFLWCKEDGRNGMAVVWWEMVQASKKLGGLEVGDALIRNTALLFKWWWRFAKEECPLWKKVVCSCHNLNPNELLSTQVLPSKGSPWKDICQVHITNSHIREKMVIDLSMKVGDGQRTHFSEDVWLLGGALKDQFPRLFSVSNQGGSVIGDCDAGGIAPRGGVECLDFSFWPTMVLSGFDERALSKLDRRIEE